jgi:hypothetical protein
VHCMLGEGYLNVRQMVKTNSHKPDCAPAMLGHCHVLCESLRVYVIYKQTLNMECVHCVSTCDKCLTGCLVRMSKEMDVGLHVKCLLLSSVSDFMMIQEMLEFFFFFF